MSNTLTKKQLLFCQEYFLDFDVYNSLLRAGYSAYYAKKLSSSILNKPLVHSYISSHTEKIKSIASVSKDKIIKELSDIAFFDGSEFSSIISSKDVDLSNNFSSLKIDKNGIQLKPYNKLKALELLGKHSGLFKEATDIASKTSINILDDISLL